MADVPTAEEYSLRTDEVAAILRIHVKTLRSWRVRKTGPPYLKIGNIILYSRKSLEEWLKKRVAD